VSTRAKPQPKNRNISRKDAKARRKNESKEVVERRKLGMETVMNLIYSISPRHTDEYHAQKARDAAALTTLVKIRNRIA
jgi:hypothetical protein